MLAHRTDMETNRIGHTDGPRTRNMNLETFKTCARAYFPTARFRNTVYCDHACIAFTILGTDRNPQGNRMARFCWFDDFGTVIDTDTGRWMADQDSMLEYLKSLDTAAWRALR